MTTKEIIIHWLSNPLNTQLLVEVRMSSDECYHRNLENKIINTANNSFLIEDGIIYKVIIENYSPQEHIIIHNHPLFASTHPIQIM